MLCNSGNSLANIWYLVVVTSGYIILVKFDKCFCFMLLQGSDSLASWQANLFFEPTKFEVRTKNNIYGMDRQAFHCCVAGTNDKKKHHSTNNLFSYRTQTYLFIEEFMKLQKEYMSNLCRK